MLEKNFFCCSCFYDQYIIEMDEKKLIGTPFINDLTHQLYLVHHQKKVLFLYTVA